MAQRLRKYVREFVLRYVEKPGAMVLNGLGLSPNAVTILGFFIVVVSASFVGLGHLKIGGLLFLIGGAMDLFDGALARLSQRVTAFGALLDSLLDRLGEAVLYLGLVVYGLHIDPDSRNLMVYISLVFLSLTSSQAVSYLRARGEALGVDSRGGLITRPERVIILAAALMLGEATTLLALGFITFFSVWTMLSRLMHIRRSL